MECWNSTRAFFIAELVEAFSLERVGKSGAKFDPIKTKWFNEQYLRLKPDQELATLIKPIAPKVSDELLIGVCGLMKERVSFCTEIVEKGAYFFNAPTTLLLRVVVVLLANR